MRSLLFDQVKKVLIEEPETRNSDALLFVRVWQRYYDMGTMTSEKTLLELMREAPPSSIQRYRAWLNQAPRFELLPTDWRVAKFRGVKREQWERHVKYEVGKRYLQQVSGLPETIMDDEMHNAQEMKREQTKLF